MLFVYLQIRLGANRYHYNETVIKAMKMLLTLKAESVSLVTDYIIEVVKGTVVMLDFYFKLKFEGGDFTSAL